MSFISIEEAFKQELIYIKGRASGDIKSLITPWESWNDIYMQGFEYGWIVTIAGASSMGKTTILNILETEIVRLNTWDTVYVLSFNFEMLARRLIGRKISYYTGKSVKDLYSAGGSVLNEKLIQNIETKLQGAIAKFPIYYLENSLTPEGVKRAIIQFIKTHKLAEKKAGLLITYDHTALGKRGVGLSERDNIGQLMNVFNDCKKIYPKSLYLILSQLNRSIEEPERKISYGAKAALNYPVRSDIYMSDTVFTLSDAVIIIHRPEVLGLQVYGPKKLPTRNITYCHHLKNRDGAVMISRLIPDLAKNNFKDIGMIR